MLIAVLSDIHANLAAMHAVLSDIEAHRVQAIYSLGDNVGYGPEPEAVIMLLRERAIRSVLGNHELGLLHTDQRNWFNHHARRALARTRELLSDDAIREIRHMPLAMVQHGCRMVHGYPPESVLTYLFAMEDSDLAATFRRMREAVCFVGHTHELALVTWDGKRVERGPLPETLHLDRHRQYIVNIGSVGQPRDGDNRAKYALVDTRTRELTLRCIPYDIKTTAESIVEKGLPPQYAERLW
jgi:diadenosine tetraphosphatase ApaH/serine/threonine PP2A family protein phosphatase